MALLASLITNFCFLIVASHELLCSKSRTKIQPKHRCVALFDPVGAQEAH